MLTSQDKNVVRDIIKEEVRELKDDMLQFKDDILTEIIRLRDDIAVTTSYRDTIEDHEARIDELEKHVYSSK